MVAALVLYTVGFLLQLLGAAGVIQDVVTSVRNMHGFKADLLAADEKAHEHRDVMEKSANDFIRQSTPAQRETYLWQLGPAAKMQRDAVVRYVTAQNDISSWRRWGAVGLLVLGVVIAFGGNLVALYA